MANSWRAELTTSVAGGFGRLKGSLTLRMYSDIESCSRALQMGERSCYMSNNVWLSSIQIHTVRSMVASGPCLDTQ